jgi:beta-galactosidase
LYLRSTMKHLNSLAVLFLLIRCMLGTQVANAESKTSRPVSARSYIDFTQEWKFLKDAGNGDVPPVSKLKWTPVNLPHTYNNYDVEDQVPGYYRGAAWYKRTLKANPNWKSKQLYLVFDGANQETLVFVNGKKAGQHAGGYTRFLVPIKDLLQLDSNRENIITVKVNNRFNKSIPPLSGDFTFFGGLYRKVSLLVVNDVHFSDPDYGSNGVYLATPAVSVAKASIKISGSLVNSAAAPQLLALRNVIKDPSGRILSTTDFPLGMAKPGKRIAFIHNLPVIVKPVLWSPEKPMRYTVSSSLIDAKTGLEHDVIQHKIGLRWFNFNAKTGFSLNGNHYKLMGASRHQDYKGMGNAVPAALQIKDVMMLKNMGGNFLRVAHYPQDQAVLQACDSLGILASVEIPIVSEITESKAFQASCLRMQLEMIRQNFNHPSVIIWAYMNEVLLKMPFEDEDRQALYMENIRKLALSLERATRKADPYRYTMISNHGNIDLYQKSGLTRVPQIVGWNIYKGWYGGKLTDFASSLDQIHREMPGVPFMVTEFGADADHRIHSFKPERFDKSVEYALTFSQVYLNEILKRPFVAGAQVWNLADFSAESREETMPHINNKGVLTHDRQPKKTYYLYSAYLLPNAYLKIGAGKNEFRSGIAKQDGDRSIQPLQVFSNTKSAELYANGKSLGIKIFKDHMATWNVAFKNGKNQFKVVSTDPGKGLKDQAEIDFKVQPETLRSKKLPFHEIAVSLGDPRYFVDEAKHTIWLPDQPYKPGSWGYIGGSTYHMEDNKWQPYGTNKRITGTLLNPIYQTQRIGLDEYRLDVPDGKYLITMHFAELVGSEMTTVLPYNLLSTYKKAAKEDRMFNIYLNHKLIANRLDLPKTFGPARAVIRKATVIINNNAGIRLQFESIKGRPVLNALQVAKLN